MFVSHKGEFQIAGHFFGWDLNGVEPSTELFIFECIDCVRSN